MISEKNDLEEGSSSCSNSRRLSVRVSTYRVDKQMSEGD